MSYKGVITAGSFLVEFPDDSRIPAEYRNRKLDVVPEQVKAGGTEKDPKYAQKFYLNGTELEGYSAEVADKWISESLSSLLGILF